MDETLDLRLGRVKPRQIICATAGGVVRWLRDTNGEVVHVEPVPVVRSIALRDHVREGSEAQSAVVEDPVEDYADTETVCSRDQLIEDGFVTQRRVYLEVVVRVVAVVGARREDRVQVDRVAPEVLDVRKAFDNAGKVPAEEVLSGRRGAPRFDTRRIVRGVTVAEPVGEDLVEDRVVYPVGDRHGHP